MTLPISPYLLPYLKTADQLPDQLPDVPEAVVQDLQARIRKLVEFVAVRDAEIEKYVFWQEEHRRQIERLEQRVEVVTK